MRPGFEASTSYRAYSPGGDTTEGLASIDTATSMTPGRTAPAGEGVESASALVDRVKDARVSVAMRRRSRMVDSPSALCVLPASTSNRMVTIEIGR